MHDGHHRSYLLARIRPPSAEELTRREIIEAYTKCGVDVDFKKRDLED
jgi:hypothetical protein